MLKNLLINEWIKAIHHKVTYLGIFFALLPPLLWTKIVRAFGEEENLNGFLFVATSVQASITGVVPVFFILFSSLLIAGEATSGTMRLVLSRPVSRLQFLVAKTITALAYGFLLLSLNFLISFLIGWIKYGFVLPEDIQSMGMKESVLWLYMCASLLLAFIPLAAVAIFGLFFSVLTRNVGTSVAFAVGLYVGIQSIKHLITFGDVAFNELWFASYTDVALARMIDLIGGYSIVFISGRVIQSILIPTVSSLVMMLIAYIIFYRRDLNY